jgi:putative MATE family efflux protein
MNRKETIYTEGSILRAVWALGWPAVTSMFSETFLSITDAFWVGKLGAVEMAAVTSSMFPIWTVFSLLAVIPTGVAAIVSRAVGAREVGEVGRTVRQSLLFAVWLGVVLSVIGFALSPAMFRIMHTEETVSRLGINYLRIFFVGAIFFVINDTFGGIFRAAGDAKAHLIGSVASIVINFVLDPLLIFGIGPFVRWGTSGASVATTIAAGCGTVVYIVMLSRGRLRYPIRFGFWERLDIRLVSTIVRIGFPTAISGVIFSVVYIFINRIVAGFGTVAIAALMIGHRMESISFLSCFGISLASSTIVGQNLGAGKVPRAARSAWMATVIGVAITGLVSIMFLVIPRQLAAFFIQDEAVISVAIDYLRILALSQTTMAMDIILGGAFAGAGNTVPPMAVSIPGSLARLPLAYYLARVAGLGINGVWWTMTITVWIKALVLMYWFSLGRWKKTGLIKT